MPLTSVFIKPPQPPVPSPIFWKYWSKINLLYSISITSIYYQIHSGNYGELIVFRFLVNTQSIKITEHSERQKACSLKCFHWLWTLKHVHIFQFYKFRLIKNQKIHASLLAYKNKKELQKNVFIGNKVYQT